MSFTAEEYEEMALFAREEIDTGGRTVDIIEFGKTPKTVGKEWEGPLSSRDNPDKKVTTKAIFVNPSSLVQLGLMTISDDLVIKSQQILQVAPGNDITDDLEDFSEVIDGDTEWKIVGVQKLRPADRTLLYFIGVKR